MASMDGNQNRRTRVVLKEYYEAGKWHYHYADDLPRSARMYIILSVIGSITQVSRNFLVVVVTCYTKSKIHYEIPRMRIFLR